MDTLLSELLDLLKGESSEQIKLSSLSKIKSRLTEGKEKLLDSTQIKHLFSQLCQLYPKYRDTSNNLQEGLIDTLVFGFSMHKSSIKYECQKFIREQKIEAFFKSSIISKGDNRDATILLQHFLTLIQWSNTINLEFMKIWISIIVETACEEFFNKLYIKLQFEELSVDELKSLSLFILKNLDKAPHKYQEIDYHIDAIIKSRSEERNRTISPKKKNRYIELSFRNEPHFRQVYNNTPYYRLNVKNLSQVLVKCEGKLHYFDRNCKEIQNPRLLHWVDEDFGSTEIFPNDDKFLDFLKIMDDFPYLILNPPQPLTQSVYYLKISVKTNPVDEPTEICFKLMLHPIEGIDVIEIPNIPISKQKNQVIKKEFISPYPLSTQIENPDPLTTGPALLAPRSPNSRMAPEHSRYSTSTHTQVPEILVSGNKYIPIQKNPPSPSLQISKSNVIFPHESDLFQFWWGQILMLFSQYNHLIPDEIIKEILRILMDYKRNVEEERWKMTNKFKEEKNLQSDLYLFFREEGRYPDFTHQHEIKMRGESDLLVGGHLIELKLSSEKINFKEAISKHKLQTKQYTIDREKDIGFLVIMDNSPQKGESTQNKRNEMSPILLGGGRNLKPEEDQFPIGLICILINGGEPSTRSKIKE